MYAAGACLESAFYLFGGWDPEAPGSGGTFKDEVWRLDLDSVTWKQLDALPCGPVSRHTACTVGDKVILHTFRGVLVLDEASGKVQEVPTTGDQPGAVSMSAACALGEDKMLLFGGSTKQQQMTADVHVLDTNTWTWTKLVVSNPDASPSPRASACAAPATDGKSAVIFGGAGLGGGGYEGGAGLVAHDETWRVMVDGTTATWVRLEVDAPPHARVAASLDPLPSGQSFVLQGGWDPKSKETFDVPYILSLD